MNGELSPNAQAILLLTAPLLAGRSRASVTPLPLGDYNNLVRHLRDTEMQPADLLDSEGLRELDNSWSGLRTRRTLEDVRQLLERGFLLAQALERWSARAIWVVTRPDDGYPNRLRKKMRGKAPPVLYGCGDRDALDGGGLAVVGSRRVNEELIEYTERVGQLAAEAEVQIVSGGARGVDQAAMRGSLAAGGHAIGVLGNNLERAALNRGNREPLMDGRLVLVSSFDPRSPVPGLAGDGTQQADLCAGGCRAGRELRSWAWRHLGGGDRATGEASLCARVCPLKRRAIPRA